MKRTSDKNNYCVYVHINKLNGKMYVGQTYNIKERWRCNGKNYFPCIKFFNAIKKYGWDNFIHEIIKDNLYREEADLIEVDLIKTFDTINNGYNLKEGGSRGELTQESLKKMSESLKRGYIEHPERKLKISQKRLGQTYSEERKKSMSLNSVRSSRITIGCETGSIRYWAKRINMTHPPLLYRKDRYGIDNLIEYIKHKLELQVMK